MAEQVHTSYKVAVPKTGMPTQNLTCDKLESMKQSNWVIEYAKYRWQFKGITSKPGNQKTGSNNHG